MTIEEKIDYTKKWASDKGIATFYGEPTSENFPTVEWSNKNLIEYILFLDKVKPPFIIISQVDFSIPEDMYSIDEIKECLTPSLFKSIEIIVDKICRQCYK